MPNECPAICENFSDIAIYVDVMKKDEMFQCTEFESKCPFSQPALLKIEFEENISK
jgi:hypothetical protein